MRRRAVAALFFLGWVLLGGAGFVAFAHSNYGLAHPWSCIAVEFGLVAMGYALTYLIVGEEDPNA